MFYLTTHSTHIIYGVDHLVKDYSDSERGNPLPPLQSIEGQIPQLMLHQLWNTGWNEKKLSGCIMSGHYHGINLVPTSSLVSLSLSVCVCVCVCVCACVLRD